MDLASRARIKKGLGSGRIMEWQRLAQEAKKAGQSDLFSQQRNEVPALELEEAEPWTVAEGLEAERQVVGFYLSGEPLDWLEPWRDYADLIRKNNERYGSHLLSNEKWCKRLKNVRKSR